MQLYPTIYIKNKQCVRLKQGLSDHINIYSDDPVTMAKYWMNKGAKFLHLVNLDGTFTDQFTSSDIFRKIAYSTPIPLQFCGGIRTLQDIEFILNCGMQRVIMGTIAVQNPGLVKEALRLFGSNKLVITVNVKDGRVSTNSWHQLSNYTPLSFCMKMEQLGASTIIIKDLTKANTLSGLDVDLSADIADKTQMHIIASGGVASLKDLENASHTNIYGVIIGKALYEKKIELKEAIRLFQ